MFLHKKTYKIKQWLCVFFLNKRNI